MAEVIRSAEITVTVDTNKRTMTQTFSGDDLADALEQLFDAIADGPLAPF